MSTTTKCPHCGAEESPRFRPARASWIEYECGTGRRSQNEPRSSHCYERQIAALQDELAKRQWQPIETAAGEEVARLKSVIREVVEVVKKHAAKAESDPAGEHLGFSELDWSEWVDHLSMALNSLHEPPKE